MIKWFILLSLLLSFQTFAQDESLGLPEEELNLTPPPKEVLLPPKKEAAVKKSSLPTNVLDFEGEVIEGERRRPDLFLQMSIDNVKFDSLIYNREDFNEYLEVDRRGRTRYLKMK